MSKQQPYIYTMPEGFMEDTSVPVKWRLYGFINGFWIGGKPVFASNEYLAKAIQCSERQIQRAIKELEDDGYLHRDGVSQNRQLLPIRVKGTTSGVVGGRRRVSQGDDAGCPHSSVSNSDSIITEANASEEYEIKVVNGNSDSDEKDTPQRKEGTKKYEELCAWAEKRRGFKFVNRVKQYSALKKAKIKDISPSRLKDRWRKLEGEDFYQEKGFDWGAVISSFDRKP